MLAVCWQFWSLAYSIKRRFALGQHFVNDAESWDDLAIGAFGFFVVLV
jgi:hypothetical protein